MYDKVPNLTEFVSGSFPKRLLTPSMPYLSGNGCGSGCSGGG